MNNSLKIGIISGFIAGIIAGILSIINALININIGLPFFNRPVITIKEIIIVEIIFSLIWGVIFGAIYSKAYAAIPGKGILKGLLFGLFGYLIYPIRAGIWMLPYSAYEFAVGYFIAVLRWIGYGLLLGFLYEFLHRRYKVTKDKLKIEEYDMKSGIFPGALGGFLGGILAFISIFMGNIIGLLDELLRGFYALPEYMVDIGFLVSQFGTHVFIHMMWGIIFGAIFAKVYNLVPGKGILKGLFYGLIILLIAGIQATAHLAVYGDIPGAWSWLLPETFSFITLGIVLGYLYKPPK